VRLAVVLAFADRVVAVASLEFAAVAAGPAVDADPAAALGESAELAAAAAAVACSAEPVVAVEPAAFAEAVAEADELVEPVVSVAVAAVERAEYVGAAATGVGAELVVFVVPVAALAVNVAPGAPVWQAEPAVSAVAAVLFLVVSRRHAARMHRQTRRQRIPSIPKFQ
jgi:hypothetical protein